MKILNKAFPTVLTLTLLMSVPSISNTIDTITTTQNFIWESFNHPTDTLLPGVKFGWKNRTSPEVYVTSWKNNDDPSPGEYTYRFDPTGYPQHVLRKGSTVKFKTGPWNGLRYSGLPIAKRSPNHIYGVILNKNEAYFSFELLNRSLISVASITLNVSGVAQTWINQPLGPVVYSTVPSDNCDIYGFF